MEEESFFVSADEADEGEAARRDARRVGDGKGDGARRAETERGDDDAFEDASDAADESFEDPIDTSNAPAASSGGEFVSGTDTDGGGHRRAPRLARPGVGASGVTRGSRVDAIEMEDDARGKQKRRESESHDERSGVGSTAPSSSNADVEKTTNGIQTSTSTFIEPTSPSSVNVGDARALAALAFASAAAEDSETDLDENGSFASAGEDATTEIERETETRATTEPDAADDSFADAADDSTIVDDDEGQKSLGISSTTTVANETYQTVPLKSPPASSASALAPPSPLAPGSSRARSGSPFERLDRFESAETDGRRDLTSPAAAFRRGPAGFDGATAGADKARESPSSHARSGWGDEEDSAPRSARSSRAEALLRDARRGSSDDASSSEGGGFPNGPGTEEPRNAREAYKRLGANENENENENENHRFVSGGASAARASSSRSPRSGSPFAEEDASARRASRRRAQREKYMAKLRDGFAEDAWMSPEEARRRAAATRRNAHSEPDGRRYRFAFDANARADSVDDSRHASFASRRSASAAYERGSATAGERRGSSRVTARAAAAEEAAFERLRREKGDGPETARGTETRSMRGYSPPGMVPPHPVGVGPEAMLWHLQQQQQMVFQQMQQLQLAQQQQRHFAGSLYLPETMSPMSPMSPSPDAFALVRANAFEEVTRLVDARVVSVHQLDAHGNSLLMWACSGGHRRLTKFLLKRGAAVNGRNAVGNTPLHFCLAGGHGELGAYLVAKGADETAANDRGATPYEGL
jgi:hypothetical protein